MNMKLAEAQEKAGNLENARNYRDQAKRAGLLIGVKALTGDERTAYFAAVHWLAEDADRRFHLRIAEITGNSAIHAVVEMLWEARDRSPQYRFLTDKAHEARVVPREDEHAKILDALRARDPAKARAAMRSHITLVVDALLKATEVHELEQAKARVEAQRRKLDMSV